MVKGIGCLLMCKGQCNLPWSRALEFFSWASALECVMARGIEICDGSGQWHLWWMRALEFVIVRGIGFLDGEGHWRLYFVKGIRTCYGKWH